MPRAMVMSRLQALWKEPELVDDGIAAVQDACIGGASIAAAAITAAAYYDNPLTGREALTRAMSMLQLVPLDLEAWTSSRLQQPVDVSNAEHHVPGFGFATPAQHALLANECRQWVQLLGGEVLRHCAFYCENAAPLTERFGGLNLAGLSALAFADCAISIADAEKRFLGWHIERALEFGQRARLEGLAGDDPWRAGFRYIGQAPPVRAFDEQKILEAVGLD